MLIKWVNEYPVSHATGKKYVFGRRFQWIARELLIHNNCMEASCFSSMSPIKMLLFLLSLAFDRLQN